VPDRDSRSKLPGAACVLLFVREGQVHVVQLQTGCGKVASSIWSVSGKCMDLEVMGQARN
jgi:hypothetical protein